ncbi:hypothetical protein HU200_064730 [Digitaria exilis]|uniref:Uncharacterized protein n=1 Tax=Digitaria exilis TaxID=1010633 RepID=A0A835A1F8_9POAL|nr:hypothetical protein HU200_064730 [Digitaria exilis]CAB3479344.1 unnamed protein product [Digitaria exilis]
MQQNTALMFISSENMAITRIQPLSSHLNCFANPANPIQDKQVYTVWMKSLVFNGHGCTIYGQDGRVAYRVDNYACHRRREVYVMDSGGKTMIKLLKKNFGVFKAWEGYSYCNGPAGLEQEDSKPWFSVQKSHKILKKEGAYSNCAMVTICMSGEVYKIDAVPHKSEYRISDPNGEVVAKMQRKQTASGVVLGEDVLSLTVNPTADRLLVVGLVVVCGLLSCCI